MKSSGYIEQRLTVAEELLDALSRRDQRWHPGPLEWVFRGQANAEWDLVPSAFRSDMTFRYSPKHVFHPRELHHEQILEEADLIRHFLLAIDRQGLPAPSEAAMRWKDFGNVLTDLNTAPERGVWPPLELAPLFALAQHHGVPTRLLDWTERPLIATYFAAVEAARRMSEGTQTDGHLAVWALDPARARALLWSDLLNKKQPDMQIVRPPRSPNPNMRAQEGVFTLLVDSSRDRKDPAAFPPLNLLVQQRIEEHISSGRTKAMPYLWKIMLPVSEAGRLLRWLADGWVDATYLYPGLDGVVRGLRERGLWDAIPPSPPGSITA